MSVHIVETTAARHKDHPVRLLVPKLLYVALELRLSCARKKYNEHTACVPTR